MSGLKFNGSRATPWNSPEDNIVQSSKDILSGNSDRYLRIFSKPVDLPKELETIEDGNDKKVIEHVYHTLCRYGKGSKLKDQKIVQEVGVYYVSASGFGDVNLIKFGSDIMSLNEKYLWKPISSYKLKKDTLIVIISPSKSFPSSSKRVSVVSEKYPSSSSSRRNSYRTESRYSGRNEERRERGLDRSRERGRHAKSFNRNNHRDSIKSKNYTSRSHRAKNYGGYSSRDRRSHISEKRGLPKNESTGMFGFIKKVVGLE